jgi:hypothetical protein
MIGKCDRCGNVDHIINLMTLVISTFGTLLLTIRFVNDYLR